jgi:hypothetical protein
MATPTSKLVPRLNLIDPGEPELTFVSVQELCPVSGKHPKGTSQKKQRSHERNRKTNKKPNSKTKRRGVTGSKWERYPLPPSGNKGKSVRTVGSFWKG